MKTNITQAVKKSTMHKIVVLWNTQVKRYIPIWNSRSFTIYHKTMPYLKSTIISRKGKFIHGLICDSTDFLFHINNLDWLYKMPFLRFNAHQFTQVQMLPDRHIFQLHLIQKYLSVIICQLETKGTKSVSLLTLFYVISFIVDLIHLLSIKHDQFLRTFDPTFGTYFWIYLLKFCIIFHFPM